ncbi:transporter [Gemmatimonas sp.]
MSGTVSTVAHAQSPVGFRSGFTEGTGIPPRGSIEADYGSSVTRSGDTRTLTAGEVTVHIPLARQFGVRVHLNSYNWTTSPAGTVEGREDIGFGTATAFRAARDWHPMVALLTRLDTPSGSLAGRAHALRPAAKIVLAWQLPAGVTLASNLGVARPGDHGTRFTQRFGSVWIARGFTPRIGSFSEVVLTDRERSAGPSTTVLRGGLTLRASHTVHVDLHASTQLGGAQPRRTLGLGVKERF